MIASTPLVCPQFIGRKNELALIVERYREAAGGAGTAVLIGGEAGIGKSRLLSTARNIIEDAGGRFALGQRLHHAQSPLGPFAEMLGELHARDPSVFAGHRALRAALARLVPELDDPDATPAGPAGDRRAQYGAIVDALRRFSEQQPIVVAIEDAHWADLASLELLGYLAQRIVAAKVLLLVTYRSDELHRRHPLTAAIGRLGRLEKVWQLQLPAFSRAEMHALLSHISTARADVPRGALSEIQALAEGNPLFAEELLRHVIEAGHAVGSPIALPLSVRAAVLDRTASLDDEGRSVLTCAAAIGRRFDIELLERISGIPGERIAGRLRQARDLQLIYEEPPDYVFRHALFQEALYAELLVAEARALHARIVSELEALPASDDRTIELAYHAWAAKDQARAGRYNEAAGDVAARRLAYHDAVRFYERSFESMSGDERAEAVLYEKLGRALNHAAIGPRARRAFERALAYYDRTGDRDKCVELSTLLAQQAWFLGDPELSWAWRKRGLEWTESDLSSPWRFATLATVLSQCALADDAERAAPYLDEAERFTGTPTTEALIRFYNFRGLIERGRGNVAGTKADLERAVAAAATFTEDPHTVASAYNNVGYAFTTLGEVETAQTAFANALRVEREHFLLDREAYSTLGLAILHCSLGEFARARTLLLESVELSVDSDAPFLRIQAASLALSVAVRTDDGELIERFAHQEIVDLAFRTGETQRFGAVAAAFSELFVQRGEDAAAVALLRRATVAARGIGSIPGLPIAVARLASPEDFEPMRRLLLRWAQPDNRAGGAYLALFDAIAAQRAGDDSTASAAAAVKGFAQIGFPWYEALAHENGGDLGAALQIYRRIGAVTDARRVEAKLNPVNRRGRAKSELTAREGEVAQLIAQGKSNKAIAEALTLSERTVEHHVASILAKLAATSRAQVAVFIARAQDRAG